MFRYFITFLYTVTFFVTCHAASFQEKIVTVDGANLYSRQTGQGTPIIVIHGAPALNQDYLLPYLAELNDTHSMVFFDQRGCGKSTSELTQINLSTFVNDIEAVRKAYGFEKVIILGHSWGGFLAMNYAIKHPEAVEKLVLLNTMPASQEDFTIFITNVMKRLAPIHSDLQAIEATESYISGDPDTVEKQLKMVFQPYLYNPADINKINLRLSRESFLSGTKVFSLLCEEIFFKPYDIFPELGSINAPTLVLHCDTDPIPSELAVHIARTIPHSQFVNLKNCGHFPFAEKPEETISALKTFLK